MAYQFKKKKATITLGANPGEKFLAAVANNRPLKTDELIKFIERAGTISEQDIRILFGALAEVIDENIAIGRAVNFKDLGVFSPNFRVSGETTPEKAGVKNIKKVVVNFRPAVKFRNEMNKAKVVETAKFKLKHE